VSNVASVAEPHRVGSVVRNIDGVALLDEAPAQQGGHADFVLDDQEPHCSKIWISRVSIMRSPS
jgi:hypothetical protein